MTASRHDWQQAPEEVLTSLNDINEKFLVFCSEIRSKNYQSVTQDSLITSWMHRVISRRLMASTPREKQSVTKFLQYLLSQITENFEHLHIDHSIHTAFYSDQPTPNHLTQMKRSIPVIILLGDLSRYHNQTYYDLCGLNRLEAFQLCHLTYTLLQQQTAEPEIISQYFTEVIALLKNSRMSDPKYEGKHYQEYITFLYQCFDIVAMQPEHIQAIKRELLEPKYRAHIKLAYIEAEYKKRGQREIQHGALADALNMYRSESWVGWIFNTLLYGLFGKHQSYTIVALNALLQQNQEFYSETQIREIIQKSEPRYAAHRLSFFEQLTETTCGTDKTLQKMSGNMICRM